MQWINRKWNVIHNNILIIFCEPFHTSCCILSTNLKKSTILPEIVYIKADDIYKDTVKDDGTRFDTSNYELGRPLPKGKY